MLCQNCGRRSSDTKSFCEHCGAVASPEMPQQAPTRTASQTRALESRASEAPRPRGPRPRETRPRPTRSGSNAFSTLIFWVVVAGGVYWFMGDDAREIRSMLQQWLQEQAASPAPAASPVRRRSPATAKPPVTAPATTPVEAPQRTRETPAARRPAAADPARGTTPPLAAPPASGAPVRDTVPALQPAVPPPPASSPAQTSGGGGRGAPAQPDIEGLSPAQVVQRLGPPPNVVTSRAITAWVYQGGALTVYFVKDRATLKPPR